MTEHAAPGAAPRAEPEREQPNPPPLDPDPELIDHLEGNVRSRRGYREEAEKLRTQPEG